MMPLFPDDTDGDEEADYDDGFDEPFDDLSEEGEVEELELAMEGKLVITGARAELVWHESELTGMEGATTKLGFALDAPGLVSMLRSGSGHRCACSHSASAASSTSLVRSVGWRSAMR